MGKVHFDFRFVKLPTGFIDDYMQELEGSELDMYLVVLRKTVGWHKMSDRISLSQFQNYTGYSIPTIRSAINGLMEKGFVNRIPAGNSYRYSITKPELKTREAIKTKSVKHEKDLQGKGQNVYNENPKNLSTQKKKQKIKLNTTKCRRSKFRSEVSLDECYSVIAEWNKMFNSLINEDDEVLVNVIREVLQYFTVKEVKRAMFNRLNTEYYREHKPQLLHKPHCFFKFLETIENDLNREPSNIYTYEEKNDLIWNGGYNDEDFKMRRDLEDESGKAKWEYMK